MWEIWSVSSFDSEGMDLTPLFKINEFVDFTRAYIEFKGLMSKGDYILIPSNKSNNKIDEYKNGEPIFESPDGGKTIYKREFLNKDKVRIK